GRRRRAPRARRARLGPPPRADLRIRPCRHLVAAKTRRRPGSSVPVLLEPRHLDRLQELLVGGLRVVGEAWELRHPPVEVCETDGQRVQIRMVLVERDGDILRVAPRDHFGISTTTLPRTTAWQ